MQILIKNLGMLLLLGFYFCSASLFAQDANTLRPLWMRYAAISPDGAKIAFTYQGDLYVVSSQGGKAYPLTLHEAYDYRPVWSPDSKHIAFASDRYGNHDVYLVDAEGGIPQRLTLHSADDYPVCFTADGKSVLFNSYRMPAATDAAFPMGRFQQLYSVPISGDKLPSMLLSAATESGKLSKDGKKMLYYDIKGYENEWRKHHTSSIARDVALYDFEKNKHTLLTTFEGEDRDPVWSPDEKHMYYLSEESGTFNVWKAAIDKPSEKTQISKFEMHPVRFLSIAQNGTLCYGYDGEIYTQKEGEQPKRIEIEIRKDARNNPREFKTVAGGASEMALSPNGKEIAFVYRGEVFVTAIEDGMTKRITNTPEQERSVHFSPDGKKLIYAGERNGSWNIYQAEVERSEEKYFYAATLIKEEVLIQTENETFQPQFSPDGKEIAFIKDRQTLSVYNIESKKIRTVTDSLSYSYSDGDQHYEWSPDSKWFLVSYNPNELWISQAGLVDASGESPIKDLTRSGYSDTSPRWGMKGKMMYWASDRSGYRSHGSWGAESDIYAMFFTKDAWNEFTMSKAEYKLWKELKDQNKDKEEDKEDNDKKKSKKKKKDEDEKDNKKSDALAFEWDGIEDRIARLTIHSSKLGGAVLTPEGDKLYYLSNFEKGYDIWVHDFKEKETKLFSKLGSYVADMEIDKEGKNLFVLASGRLQKIDLNSGAPKPISISSEMEYDAAAEREYMFEHLWRQVREKFYLKDLHGTDWDTLKVEYKKFLQHIDNNYDFAEMASELLGELNASHTGSGYRKYDPKGDQTAALGAFFDPTHKEAGIKIQEILPKSPLLKADTQIKAGDIITKVDGTEITAGMNYWPLFNRKAGDRMLLEVKSGSESKQVIVKPFSWGAQTSLLYDRWVASRRDSVEKRSKGQIGYVHVKGMDSQSFRKSYSDALGKNATKKALIVDTRFNGGGWLHDDLATFLSGEQYFEFRPRGRKIGIEPMTKWTKPSVVLVSEGNYSDAHIFPYVYQHLGIGKLIGMPVPGTGTAVWWETLIDPSLYFGIPQVTVVRTADGKYMENTQLEPDIKVKNPLERQEKGIDSQLNRAVEELLKEVDKK
ncbi:MAG: PD40 domain-containing protein [Bernardetiaceae bacterium]|nr:PD40 domain-containing protein [Bernardetiaceae bacterium]